MPPQGACLAPHCLDRCVQHATVELRQGEHGFDVVPKGFSGIRRPSSLQSFVTVVVLPPPLPHKAPTGRRSGRQAVSFQRDKGQ